MSLKYIKILKIKRNTKPQIKKNKVLPSNFSYKFEFSI